MIFRGSGQIISLAEKAEYDSDVIVLWQIHGWQNSPTQMQFGEACLREHMKKKREDWQKEHGEGREAPYGIMVQDNLKCQCSEELLSF